MKKKLLLASTVALALTATATDISAQGRGHGGWRGAGPGAGRRGAGLAAGLRGPAPRWRGQAGLGAGWRRSFVGPASERVGGVQVRQCGVRVRQLGTGAPDSDQLTGARVGHMAARGGAARDGGPSPLASSAV